MDDYKQRAKIRILIFKDGLYRIKNICIFGNNKDSA